MDRESMSNEENYCFDVGGYLIVRGVLGRGEVAALNSAIDNSGRSQGMLGWPHPHREPFRDLLVHPHLVWYLNQIVGHGFRLETEPELLCDDTCETDAPLNGGNEPRDPTRAYYYQNGRRFSETVRVVWALADAEAGAGGFVIVPCSHRSNVETPDDVLTGNDDMGLTQQPALRAGDLLIVAGALLQGMRAWKGVGPQRLLSYEFAGRGVIRTPGTGPAAGEDPAPEWMSAITAEQRASLHRPGYRTTTPPPTILTDGKSVRLDESRDVYHPSIYVRNADSGIDEKEFYFWDLCGHLVLRNVMDDGWLEQANEAVDRFEDRIEVGRELSGGSRALAGTGRPLLSGLLQLPEPYCDPFRRMVAHPVVEHRLNWMGASGGRMGGATAFCSVKGGSGHSLHDANEPLNPGRGYIYQNGRSYCEAVTVSWQLRDVPAGLGGFACVPGSHKAQYRMPPGVRSCDDHMGLVVQPAMKAGDVLFFMDGGQTHGALAWKNEIARRAVLIKYSSRNFNRSGGEMAHPENRWGDLVEEMDDAQLAVMRGPDRDVFNQNVPRLEVSDGRVSVSYERGGALYSSEAPTGPVTPKGSSASEQRKGD